jgi:hypothetical protein
MNQPAQKDSVTLLDRDMVGKNLSGYWRLGMEGLPVELDSGHWKRNEMAATGANDS